MLAINFVYRKSKFLFIYLLTQDEIFSFRSHSICLSICTYRKLIYYKMPQLLTEQNNSDNDIKVKTAYNGNIMITYVKENVTYEELCREIRGICRFSPDQVSKNLLKLHNRICKIDKLSGVYFEMGGRGK